LIEEIPKRKYFRNNIFLDYHRFIFFSLYFRKSIQFYSDAVSAVQFTANSMEQSYTLGFKNCSIGEEIYFILRNTKVHYHFFKVRHPRCVQFEQ